MAKGFFDLVDAYNKSGYGAFQNNAIGPEELAQLYAASRGGGDDGGYMTSHQKIGRAAGQILGGIGGLIYERTPTGKAKLEERQRKARVTEDAQEAMRVRLAEILAEKPNMDPREALQQAAKEEYAGTVGIQMPGPRRKYGPVAREAALPAMLGPEKETTGTGTKKVLLRHKITGEERWFDTKTASEEELKDWDIIDQSKQTKVIADPQNPESKTGYVYERDERSNRWIPSIDENGNPLRAPIGGVNVSVDTGGRSKGDISTLIGDTVERNVAFSSANQIIDGVVGMAADLPWAPGQWVGSLAVLADKMQGVREAALSLSGAKSSEEKYFDEGTKTAAELLNPANYGAAFEKLAKAGITSQRIQARLLDLAFMIAVAEEASGRGISDADVERRLLTLGMHSGSKESFAQVLADAQEAMYIKYKARIEQEPLLNQEYGDEEVARQIKAVRNSAYQLLEQWKPKDRTGAAARKPSYADEVGPLRPSGR